MYGYSRPSRLARTMKWLLEDVLIPLIVIVFNITTFFILLLTGPIMWLWNGCFVPAFTSFPHVGFWQTFGLLIMMRLIRAVITG